MSSRQRVSDLRGTWPKALASLAGSLLLILTIRWALVEPYVIPSESMLPTLLVHDHILVNKFAYGLRLPFTERYLFRFAFPKRGDVLVFRSVDDDHVFLVKRVIGLPGDTIRLTRNGLFINGAEVPSKHLSQADASKVVDSWKLESKAQALETYDFFRAELPTGGARTVHSHIVLRDILNPVDDSPATKVPDDQLFMSGDNRDHSADSRVWGTLPFDRVLGRASVIWLSCEEALAQSGQLCNPQTIRWQRLFSKIL